MSLRAINQAVGAVSASVERAAEWFALARAVASHPDDILAAYTAASREVPDSRVAKALKAAVSVGGTGNLGALVDYQILAAGFLESLRSLSVYDRLLSDGMRRVPLEQRLAVVSVALVGGGIAEGQVKPVSTMSLNIAALVPHKSVAMIVCSDELLRFSSTNAVLLFNSELRSAVVAATDLTFLSGLISETTPIPSGGSTVDAILTDLGNLLDSIDPKANSKVYFIAGPEAAQALVMARSAGAPAFPGARLDGGEVLAGVPLLVSDMLPANTALMVDAASLVGGSDTITVDSSKYSTIALDSAPMSPPSAAAGLESLFQSGRSAIKCERLFGWDVARPSGVASLSGVNW